MSFKEKSAWLMGAVMLSTGIFYVYLMLHSGGSAMAAFVPYVFAVVVLSVLAHIGLAISSPKEAQAPADERERIVSDKAGHWSGIALATGVVLALLAFLFDPSGNAGTDLFHRALLVLIAAQLFEYVAQIYLLRRHA